MAAAASLAMHREAHKSELDKIRDRRKHLKAIAIAQSAEAQHRVIKASNLNPEKWPSILTPYLLFAQQCDNIACSSWFANYILICILIAGALVGVQTYPAYEDDVTIYWMDVLILWSFTLEVVLKIVGEGMGPHYFFIGPDRSWNIFDFLIVLLSMPFIPFAAGQIKLLRLIRLMRLTKAFRKIPQLQMILMGLVGGLDSIVYIVILMILVFYLYACAGILFFRDNDPFHFNSIEVSMLTLLGVATLDGWGEIMFINYFGCAEYNGGYYVESKDEEDPKFGGMSTCVSSAQPVVSALYFLSFIVIAAFCILSLFISSVAMSMVESMQDMKKTSKENQERRILYERTQIVASMENKQSLDRKSLRRLRLIEIAFQGQDVKDVENEKFIGHNRDGGVIKAYRQLAYLCQDITESNYFSWFITGVIVLAGVTVGINTDPKLAEEYFDLLAGLDFVIQYIFLAELVLKFIGEEFRPWRYFNDNWNCFDFVVVVGSFLPTGSGSLITILRLLRLLRVLKLLRALPQLQVIVSALLKGLSAIAYISVILAMFFYFFGIIAITFFGANDVWHFGSLHMSMLTLFQCATMDNWSSIMWISLYGCDVQDGDNPDLCTNPQRQFLLATLFFLIIILVGALVLLTLFIGVVGMSMEEASQEQKKDKEIEDRAVVIGEVEKLDIEQIRLYKEVFESLDLISSGRIGSEELKFGLTLAGLQMDEEDFREVWNKVDRDNSNGIDFAEFLEFMCDLKSNLSLLKEVEAEEDEDLNEDDKGDHRMEKLHEATDRRQFNFQKKVDVKRLDRHGSIMTNVLSEAQFVQKKNEGAFVGFGNPFAHVAEEGEEGGEEEGDAPKSEGQLAQEEEARKKEEKELYKAASVVSKEHLPSFTAKGGKKTKAAEEKYRSDKPGKGEEQEEEQEKQQTDERRAKKEQRVSASGTKQAHSPDTESTARQEQSLGQASASPTSKDRLKPSVPPLSKTAISPSGDRHKYTVTRAQSSFNKIDMGMDGLQLGEMSPETPLKRPVPQGASPYTPSKKPVKSLVVSI